jgi:hypothetical protein
MTTINVQPMPHYLKVLAFLIALMVLAQFLTAGLSLFVNSGIWACHTGAGFALGLPVVALLIASFADAKASVLRWWTVGTTIAWMVQVGLIVFAKKLDVFFLQGLHPFDGALLLVLATGLCFRSTDRAESFGRFAETQG